MDNDKRFGKFIRAVRIRVCKISLRDAANKIDISAPYLSRIESGREHPPRIDILQKMSAVYKIPVQKFIDRAANRAQEAFGEQIAPSPVLSVFFKFIKEKDLPEERIIEVIKQVCQEKGWNEKEFLDEIQKRKQRLPRLLKDGDGLFAADVSPRFLSKKKIAEIANRLMRRHNIGEGQYIAPTNIELLAEKERGVRLYYDDKMRVFRSGEPVELGRSHWSPDEDNIREVHINNALADGEHSNINRLRFTVGHELFHCIEHLILMDEKERLVTAFSRLLAEKEILDAPGKSANPHIEKWFQKPNKRSE
ncbi:MAG: helix-turn-helix transcriptional regulator, partial [Candidatus Omnitrophica bacterium]|nr:helix-turn-helix transcriptional regulator [Candidatus Omnitrophota bacterium]